MPSATFNSSRSNRIRQQQQQSRQETSQTQMHTVAARQTMQQYIQQGIVMRRAVMMVIGACVQAGKLAQERQVERLEAAAEASSSSSSR
jgi:triphosphoribosyl-dephospho-CoA synthetase